jgi:hypothetical protein
LKTKEQRDPSVHFNGDLDISGTLNTAKIQKYPEICTSVSQRSFGTCSSHSMINVKCIGELDLLLERRRLRSRGRT